MPSLPRKVIVFLSYSKLLFKPGWIMPKPIYTACGLLLVAGILMMTVVYGLKDAGTVPNDANKFALLEGRQPAAQLQEPVVVIQPQPAVKASSPDSAASAPVAAQSQDYDKESPRWPVRGQIIFDFGWQQHPVYNDWRYHNGIDVAAAEGQPVQAVLGGVVEEIYNDKHYGQTVVVKSGRYTIIYGSLNSVAVSQKDIIANGAKIGIAGTFSAEPQIHVHLAIKDGDKFIDPQSILK
ncbi:MAG: M23 family metallopeptidase [Veillonellaceae bacterium]|jgi:murein DD-endopeptidase MepM/ murein hydrolase activator NlpD|nr:M23 family metallopeptidase [Veillonellaceae bacterium]